MITGSVTLHNFGDWHVRLFFAVSTYYTDEIMDALEDIGCEHGFMRKAYRNLTSRTLDRGLTYANPSLREAVMVVSLSSCAAEFENSYTHERKHLERYIERNLRIYPYGEAAAYLSGEIARAMHKYAAPLMCDCCRHKHLKRYDYGH